MNNQLIEQARNAYRAGDFATAANLFGQAKQSTEIDGEVDHLRGNSLMRLGMYADAASAYEAALTDSAYGKRGALLTNQGKALAAAGDQRGAAASFNAATQDASYATPYKAYLGLGSALLSLGQVAEAGTAFRQAAIDGTNPAPASALSQLADCFIRMNRPQDAVETYRTALDFCGPRDDSRAIYAGMGTALAASNRAQDAVEAFGQATADGLYQLTDEQSAAYQNAQSMLASAQRGPVSTSPYGAVDPLDPLGKSGQFMPDPSDTGFFTLSESEMVQQDRAQAKVRRKRRHTGLKVFLVIFILLLIAAGGLGYLYTQGMGFPSQESVLSSLFTAVSDGDTSAAEECISSNLDDESKQLIIATIPSDATPTIEGLDKTMTTSTAQVNVELSSGGSLTYQVEFERSSNHIGWAVSSLDIVNASTDSDSSK